MVRMMWAELNGFVSDVVAGTASAGRELRPMVDGVREVRACLCVDAKSIYDCLAKQVQMQSLAEKRTALELMAFERCIEETGLIVRWCHSEANLSDSLTKASAYGPIELYMRTGSWVLVYDEEQLSAKKRKERGLTRFETNKKDFAGLLREVFQAANIPIPDAADNGEEDDRDQVCGEPPKQNV